MKISEFTLRLNISGVFARSKKVIKALVDTGFDGYLTLPFAEAFPLGLVLIGVTSKVDPLSRTSFRLD